MRAPGGEIWVPLGVFGLRGLQAETLSLGNAFAQPGGRGHAGWGVRSPTSPSCPQSFPADIGQGTTIQIGV